MIAKILVPIDFSPCSDAALAYALRVASECGAEVQVLHVWCPRATIFAASAQGIAMERRLSAAEESGHPARVWGRLEFGEEPSIVILDILEHEPFDLVVMGRDGMMERAAGGRVGHVASKVSETAPCKVVTMHARGTPAPTP
jgi:universal stress protein A